MISIKAKSKAISGKTILNRFAGNGFAFFF
jgi:hypothetical protein